jgi:hypothetical protein
MEFWIDKSILHYFDPRDSKFTFVKTVSENKAGFTNQQIKDVEVTRSLYSKLNYLSWKDFKWIIWSNQIKDCQAMVEHIDAALKIWGKNVMVFERKDHLDQTRSIGKGLCEGSSGTIEAPQRGVRDC